MRLILADFVLYIVLLFFQAIGFRFMVENLVEKRHRRIDFCNLIGSFLRWLLFTSLAFGAAYAASRLDKATLGFGELYATNFGIILLGVIAGIALSYIDPYEEW